MFLTLSICELFYWFVIDISYSSMICRCGTDISSCTKTENQLMKSWWNKAKTRMGNVGVKWLEIHSSVVSGGSQIRIPEIVIVREIYLRNPQVANGGCSSQTVWMLRGPPSRFSVCCKIEWMGETSSLSVCLTFRNGMRTASFSSFHFPRMPNVGPTAFPFVFSNSVPTAECHDAPPRWVSPGGDDVVALVISIFLPFCYTVFWPHYSKILQYY